MGFLHSSRPRGRVRQALRLATDVRFVGFDGKGSTVTNLHFEVPQFGSAAKEFFEQQTLWEDRPQRTDTAFELFGAALSDVVARQLNSSKYDPPLLKRIGKYKTVLDRGIDSVSLTDTALSEPGRIDRAVIAAASELAAVTPRSRRVRVAGRLDLMGASQGVLKIEVRAGDVVTALWDGKEPIEIHRNLFNRDVILEGRAVFRPSGTLLRIDADVVAPASIQDDLFREVPSAIVARDYAKSARLKPGERSAYRQLRGSIPAEETDEEFEAALAALR